MKPDTNRPPLYTIWEEFCGWTLDATGKTPKSQRFSFGQRIDGHTLDVLELIVLCIYRTDRAAGLRPPPLRQRRTAYQAGATPR